MLPGQNALTGTNTTTQKSPLLNLDAPINACSLSIGLFANAASSCSTTSVGLDQLGAIGTINIPITAQYNAIGLLGAGREVARPHHRAVVGLDDAGRRHQCVRADQPVRHQRRPRGQHRQ